jgi:hypothetical protein
MTKAVEPLVDRQPARGEGRESVETLPRDQLVERGDGALEPPGNGIHQRPARGAALRRSRQPFLTHEDECLGPLFPHEGIAEGDRADPQRARVRARELGGAALASQWPLSGRPALPLREDPESGTGPKLRRSGGEVRPGGTGRIPPERTGADPQEEAIAREVLRFHQDPETQAERAAQQEGEKAIPPVRVVGDEQRRNGMTPALRTSGRAPVHSGEMARRLPADVPLEHPAGDRLGHQPSSVLIWGQPPQEAAGQAARRRIATFRGLET